MSDAPLVTRLRITEEAKRVLDRWGAPAVVGARRMALRRWSQGWVRELVKATPKGWSGNLRRNWKHTLFEKGAIVENEMTYARWVEEGTGLYGPHHQRIVPTSKKALHWHSSRPPSAFNVGTRALARYEASGMVRRSVKGMKPRAMFAKTLAAHPPRTEFPPIMMESLALAFLTGGTKVYPSG